MEKRKAYAPERILVSPKLDRAAKRRKSDDGSTLCVTPLDATAKVTTVAAASASASTKNGHAPKYAPINSSHEAFIEILGSLQSPSLGAIAQVARLLFEYYQPALGDLEGIAYAVEKRPSRSVVTEKSLWVGCMYFHPYEERFIDTSGILHPTVSRIYDEIAWAVGCTDVTAWRCSDPDWPKVEVCIGICSNLDTPFDYIAIREGLNYAFLPFPGSDTLAVSENFNLFMVQRDGVRESIGTFARLSYFCRPRRDIVISTGIPYESRPSSANVLMLYDANSQELPRSGWVLKLHKEEAETPGDTFDADSVSHLVPFRGAVLVITSKHGGSVYLMTFTKTHYYTKRLPFLRVFDDLGAPVRRNAFVHRDWLFLAVFPDGPEEPMSIAHFSLRGIESTLASMPQWTDATSGTSGSATTETVAQPTQLVAR